MVNKSSKIVLFLLNPFISAVDSLKDIRDGYSHKLLYAWFIIFGVGFCAANTSADSFRYVDDFYRESQYSWDKYVQEIAYWFSFEGETKDVYTLTINYVVGLFSHNYHWTFFIYAIVFGFFYIESLKIFLKYSKRNDWLFYTLLFIFCYSNPIFNINGVRFWTAAWIGVYVSLQLFVENKYRYLPLLILMPVIHGSSVIWIGIMVVAWLTKSLQNIWVVLFILSSFVSALSYMSVINEFSDLLPQFMQNQIWAYTESDSAFELMSRQASSSYYNVLMSLPGYFRLLLGFLIVFNRKRINTTNTRKNLLTIFLSLSAMTNFLSGIPSAGRFISMVIPFLVIVWVQSHDILKKYDILFYLVPFVYAYSLLYWFRNMSSVTELYLYVFPAPLTIVKYLFLS